MGNEKQGTSWQHFPDSPWGDVEICPHGLTRDVGSRSRTCVWCDLEGKPDLLDCVQCEAITWHHHDKCMRCDFKRALHKEMSGGKK